MRGARPRHLDRMQVDGVSQCYFGSNGRRRQEPFRGHFESGAAVPAYRPFPAGEVGFLFADGSARQPARASPSPPSSRQAALAEACRRLVMETYAPAAVLISPKFECLYSMGPTERYLHVPQGHPNYDLLAMVRPHLRTKLRAAIHQAIQAKARVLIPGGRTNHEGKAAAFAISVQPTVVDGEDLLLICFIDEPAPARKLSRANSTHDTDQVADLRQQLDATQMELQAAIESLETSNEGQKAINEEALSVNEEYQATNEELLTSKEKLQSLNEELTALNSQLQETLERQRTTASDLQNILYSTNVGTIFLDIDLDIRFFTPPTKSLFNIIPTDIGRPLADLNPLGTADVPNLGMIVAVRGSVVDVRFDKHSPPI